MSDAAQREVAPERLTRRETSAGEPTAWLWIAGLATAKTADSVTTLLALRLPSIREINPLVAGIHATLGRTPGELFVAVVGTIALIVAIELVAWLLVGVVRGPASTFRSLARRIGYGTAALLFFAVAVSNTVQYIIHM